jgi:hypothetical protein
MTPVRDRRPGDGYPPATWQNVRRALREFLKTMAWVVMLSPAIVVAVIVVVHGPNALITGTIPAHAPLVARPARPYALVAQPTGGEPIEVSRFSTRAMCEIALQDEGRALLARGVVVPLTCQRTTSWWQEVRHWLEGSK